METFSDNNLMLKVKEGNLDLMGLLFERYNRQLYGFFYHMTADMALSKDLIQNSFYRMLKYRNSYTGNGEFKSWMYHLARNVLADHYKKNKRYQKGLIDDLEEKLMADDLSALIEKEDSLALLKKAMDKLPADKREVLLLTKYQSLKYSEVAAILECTENAVKVKVFRALQELKDIYFQMERV